MTRPTRRPVVTVTCTRTPQSTDQDQDSVTSGSDGLVPSDGSHMGSVSVDSIDSDSITDLRMAL